MTQDVSKGKIGRMGKWVGMVNYNVYFTNDFNTLVMNITKINFLN